MNYSDEQYWNRWTAKTIGSIYGILIAIQTFNGEWWLDDNNAVFTLTQFKDNFQLPIALLVLGMSIVGLFMVAESYINKDWEKNTNESQ